jgi:cation transport regulator
MPYSTNAELPPPVRRALPAHAQDIYRAAFNAAWFEHADDPVPDEATPHRIAWAAVKRQYRKAGGQWLPVSAAATGGTRLV